LHGASRLYSRLVLVMLLVISGPDTDPLRGARGEVGASEARRLIEARGDVPARCATADWRRSHGAAAVPAPCPNRCRLLRHIELLLTV